MQKPNQKEFRIEKVIKKKGNKLYVKWEGYSNSFHVWIDKKDIVSISEYFPKPKPLGANVKFKLNLFNYATETDLKNATNADMSDFAKKIDLSNLRSAVYKLDIYKLKDI